MISPAVLLVAAAVLLLAGAALLVVQLRQGRPRDAAGAVGVVLGSALVGVAGLLVWLASSAPAPGAGPRPGEPRVGPEGLGTAMTGMPSLLPSERDAPAPDVRYTRLDGRTASLADLRGRVVLVNLWATWCGPCVREMPDLARLADRYAGMGLTVVALSDEPRETVAPFAEQHDVGAITGLADLGALPAPFGRASDTRPVTVLIGRDGRLKAMAVGAQSYAQFEALIADEIAPNVARR